MTVDQKCWAGSCAGSKEGRKELDLKKKRSRGDREMHQGEWYWLLFQRTWVPFLAATWQVTSIDDSSFRGLKTLFWPA